MADTPALAPEYGYYQRLLARDQSEAADLIERHIKTEPPRSVYDALLLPALNYAERDRLEQRLSLEEETAVIDATRELLSDAAESIRRLAAGAARPARWLPPSRTARTAARAGLSDQRHCRRARARDARASGGRSADRGRDHEGRACWPRSWCRSSGAGLSVVCLADLPPSPPSKTRYLVKRLHAALPEVRILVGRWGPPALADDSTHAAAGSGRDARGLDAGGDADVPGRAGGDSADPTSGRKQRGCLTPERCHADEVFRIVRSPGASTRRAAGVTTQTLVSGT